MGTIQSTLCNPSPVCFSPFRQNKNNAGKCPALPLFNSISVESATSPSFFSFGRISLPIGLALLRLSNKNILLRQALRFCCRRLALPGIRCQGRPASAFFSSFLPVKLSLKRPSRIKILQSTCHSRSVFFAPSLLWAVSFLLFLILHCFFVLFYSLYCQTSTPPANTFAIPARAVFLHKKRTRIARSFAFFIFPPVSHL